MKDITGVKGKEKEKRAKKGNLIPMDWSPYLGLDSDDVVVGSALEDLGHGAKVHAHGELAVTPVRLVK